MAFEEVEAAAPEYWKPEEIGDDIEGNIYDIKPGQYGKQIVLDMGDDEDGEIITTTLPAHKQLQNFIPKLQVGDYIRVELIKQIEPTPEQLEKQPNRSPTNIYKVQKDPERFEEYE